MPSSSTVTAVVSKTIDCVSGSVTVTTNVAFATPVALCVNVTVSRFTSSSSVVEIVTF